MIVLNQWNTKKRSILNTEPYPPLNIYENNSLIQSSSYVNDFDFMNDLRRAAECHKIVRRYAQSTIKPNMKVVDIANLVENKIAELFGKNNLEAGIAFPIGISINNVIAHDSSNPNDDRILGQNDVCKLDIGTHVNGRIIDSAFTIAFNPEYKNLLLATKEATWTGIKLAGPDALCNDISTAIKEVIESYEVEIGKKLYSIKSVCDLGGHSIDQYDIHAGTLILSGPSDTEYYKNMRLKANTQYAIETFASTGTGKFKQGDFSSINHFMMNKDPPKINYQFSSTRDVHRWILKNRKGLPFTQRWITTKNNKLGLKELVDKRVITGYPPLYDIKGSFSSQFEHTLYIHDSGKEVLSQADDY